jgi:hypothetical protein
LVARRPICGSANSPGRSPGRSSCPAVHAPLHRLHPHFQHEVSIMRIRPAEPDPGLFPADRVVAVLEHGHPAWFVRVRPPQDYLLFRLGEISRVEPAFHVERGSRRRGRSLRQSRRSPARWPAGESGSGGSLGLVTVAWWEAGFAHHQERDNLTCRRNGRFQSVAFRSVRRI